MKELSLKELKEDKLKLESDLHKLLVDFMNKYNTKVNCIELSYLETVDGVPFLVGVDLEVVI